MTPDRMTDVYITIDTEYSSGFAARAGISERAANFARSIACETPDGAVGEGYQLVVFEAHTRAAKGPGISRSCRTASNCSAAVASASTTS